MYAGKSEWAVFHGSDEPDCAETVVLQPADQPSERSEDALMVFDDISAPFAFSGLTMEGYSYHSSELNVLQDLRKWN